MTKLWRYNKITGYWVIERSCLIENAAQWLVVYQNDMPQEIYKINKNRPR